MTDDGMIPWTGEAPERGEGWYAISGTEAHPSHGGDTEPSFSFFNGDEWTTLLHVTAYHPTPIDPADVPALLRAREEREENERNRELAHDAALRAEHAQARLDELERRLRELAERWRGPGPTHVGPMSDACAADLDDVLTPPADLPGADYAMPVSGLAHAPTESGEACDVAQPPGDALAELRRRCVRGRDAADRSGDQWGQRSHAFRAVIEWIDALSPTQNPSSSLRVWLHSSADAPGTLDSATVMGQSIDLPVGEDWDDVLAMSEPTHTLPGFSRSMLDGEVLIRVAYDAGDPTAGLPGGWCAMSIAPHWPGGAS